MNMFYLIEDNNKDSFSILDKTLFKLLWLLNLCTVKQTRDVWMTMIPHYFDKWHSKKRLL